MKFELPKIQARSIPPIILINWALGIGVFEYPMGKPRRIMSVFSSIINFLIYLSLVRLANFSEIRTLHRSHIAASNYRKLNLYFCPGFVAISICHAQIQAKTISMILRRMTVINDKLKKLGVPDDLKLAFRSQIIQISAVLTFIFIAVVLNFGNIGFNLRNESSHIASIICYHYFWVFAYVVDGNFSGGIRYLGNRFERLNELLEESDSAERRKMMIVTQESHDQFERYFSVINEIHQSNSLAIKAAKKRWLLYVVRETRIVHQGLCKVGMELNRALGIQLLFSVALSFGLVTALCYGAYVIVIESYLSNSLLNDFIVKIIVLMWITFFAMKIYLVFHACETTSCEANRTGGLIGKLLDAADSDEDIRDEVNIFSLQLIQNPLNFTACGFFPLNYSLIREMIGSVTTYLVIMIQMRTIYDLENANSKPNSTMLAQMNITN